MRKAVALVTLLCIVQDLSAEDCDIRASLVDLRDKGISFGLDYRAIMSQSDASIGDLCKVFVQSTGLSSPRSSIAREYSGQTSGQNIFNRKFIIGNPILAGYGSLAFAVMKFKATGGEYQLKLSISAGAPIPKGSTYSPSYRLSATLDTLDEVGAVTGTRQAFNPQYVANGQNFNIVWKAGTRPLPYTWVTTRTLEVNFGGNNVQNILDFDMLESQYTGVLEFYPHSEVTGILYEVGLEQGQLKFSLGGHSEYR